MNLKTITLVEEPTASRLVKNYYTFYATLHHCYINSAAGLTKIFTRESRLLFDTASETTCLLRNMNFDYRSVRFCDVWRKVWQTQISNSEPCAELLVSEIEFVWHRPSLSFLHAAGYSAHIHYSSLRLQVLQNVPPVASVALIKGTVSSCRIPGHHVSDVLLSDTKTSGC